jgi:hypothetical protein
MGRLLRAIRRRVRPNQNDVARISGVPRGDVMLIEAGRAGEVQLDRVRRVFAVVEARLKALVWWNGAAADRLLDERHAGVAERFIGVLGRYAWLPAPEVTFSEFGERGSIDVLGAHPITRAAVVAEIKASVGSLEETNRTLDVKVRLAPKLVLARFGWRPVSVSRLLVLPEDRTLRRVIDRHAATMAALYPLRGTEVRAWLRNPDPGKPISGILLLSEVAERDRVRR